MSMQEIRWTYHLDEGRVSMKTIFAALILSSCGVANESSIQWGALRGFDKRFTLLAANTLLLCGDVQLRSVANNALWEWNNARGRHHRLTSSASCASRYRYDASVNVAFNYCNPNVVGYHTQDGNHHNITVCYAAQSSAWRRVLTHELGHGFGLCDQYAAGNASQIAFHANCGWPRSARAERSVMGGLYAGSPEWLTADDVAGIRALSQ
jgi:hypothetical protein